MKKSRTRKLDHFYSLCKQGSNVIDVGVSNNEHNEQINLFLNNFRLPADQYTGLGVVNLNDVAMKHPDKKFVSYPGGVFPFKDNEFDWVFSNAVVEHVGNRAEQLLFINEMLRVGKNVFFTTPNKYFPVESHTNVVFRHWFDDGFYKWCSSNKPNWTRENLLLLSNSNLSELMKHSDSNRYKIQKNRLAGMVMTFTVVCSQE